MDFIQTDSFWEMIDEISFYFVYFSDQDEFSQVSFMINPDLSKPSPFRLSLSNRFDRQKYLVIQTDSLWETGISVRSRQKPNSDFFFRFTVQGKSCGGLLPQ